MLVSDVADWELARDADDRAFGRLFDRHSARVFRHSLRLVAVPAEADEVMASTFFELWRRRADVRLVDDSVVPWLLATATYLSRNRIRGRLRYQRVIGRLPREESEDAAETALARLEQLEQRRRLAGALRSLSATDAALVALTRARRDDGPCRRRRSSGSAPARHGCDSAARGGDSGSCWSTASRSTRAHEKEVSDDPIGSRSRLRGRCACRAGATGPAAPASRRGPRQAAHPAAGGRGRVPRRRDGRRGPRRGPAVPAGAP